MKYELNLTLNIVPKISRLLAEELKGGEVLALMGPLGSGKTAFVKHLARQLKVKSVVTSPTFVLMNVFPAHLPKTKKAVSLLHLDLYRTKNFREIKALGLTEVWGKPDTLTVIEWADKIKTHLPKNAWRLKFHHEKPE